MQRFPILTLDTAPEGSKPYLQQLQQAFGLLPNIAGGIANSPALMKSFTGFFQNVHGGTLSEAEIQVLLLTNAVTNAAAWAVAFHSFLGLQAGLTREDVDAIRARRLPQDPHMAALSDLARTLINERGNVSESMLDTFIAAGFRQDQILEVIGVSAASTITNYVTNVIHQPLEPFLQAHSWRR
jgi:alkylhydroperoxidase family enzyme